MRVLVTGGTGFIGSHTVAALCAAGHRVRLLVRDPEKVERVFGPRGLAFDDLVVGDVVDEAAVTRALEGCDGVVHAAAMVSLKAREARRVLETNARAVDLVVGGAHRRGIDSIVYVSSVGALFRPGGPVIGPDSPVVPGRNAYAKSKAEAELFVRRLQDEGAPIHTTYPAGVVGPDDPGLSASNHALRTYVKTTMVMTSSGFQAVDVRDLAEVHRRLLERGGRAGRWVVGGHYLPWRGVADLIDELTGARVRRVPAPGGMLRFLGHIGDFVKRIVDFDFPLTSESMEFATLWPGADDAKTLAELGMRWRDARETYAESYRWLHRAGHLKAGQVGRLGAG